MDVTARTVFQRNPQNPRVKCSEEDASQKCRSTQTRPTACAHSVANAAPIIPQPSTLMKMGANTALQATVSTRAAIAL